MPAKEWAPNTSTDSIREVIESTGLSRKEVARRIGITIGAIDKWIGSGRIPIDQLAKIQELARIDDLVRQAQGSAVSGVGADAVANLHLHAPLIGEPAEAILKALSNPSEFLLRFDRDQLVEALEVKGYEVFLRKKPKAQ